MSWKLQEITKVINRRIEEETAAAALHNGRKLSMVSSPALQASFYVIHRQKIPDNEFAVIKWVALRPQLWKDDNVFVGEA